MPTEAKIVHRLIANSAIAYRSYTDITNDEPNWVAGQNIVSSARLLSERRPGWADAVESVVTTFRKIVNHDTFQKWNGDYFSIVNDCDGVISKIYAFKFGTSTSYSLIHTSAAGDKFFWVKSNDTLYFANGTDAKKFDGTSLTTAAVSNWGIARPSAAPGVGTSGTGTSTYAGGWYYCSTYGNSITGHESSSSALSACTGNFSNKQVDVSVTASTDTQVDQIRVYRTTDGGSTDPSGMQEISGSPFTNTTISHADTTADGSLGTRTAPTTTSNDPPPSGFIPHCVYAGRVFGSKSATTYFSAFEEIGNGVPEESFPSGLGGNFYPWDAKVKSQTPMPDGVAIFVSGRIWKIAGDRRDNFVRYKLVERRGTTNHQTTVPLGNDMAWFDTAKQLWLSQEGEYGFDIRTDLDSVSPATAYSTAHIAGKQHWLMTLDSPNGKVYVFDLDTKQWMVPWVVPEGSTALSSGEVSAGDVRCFLAIGGTQMYMQNASRFNDAGTAYQADGTLNLLRTSPASNSEAVGQLDYVVLETDANIADDVLILRDDDPATGTYTSIVADIQDPPLRNQGINLIKKKYMGSQDNSERASIKFVWNIEDSAFKLYGCEICWHVTATQK